MIVESNSDDDIVPDITGILDGEVSDKQSLTVCDRSESHLNEEGNDIFNLKGRIKAKFVIENVVYLSRQKLTKVEISLVPKGLNFVPTNNNIKRAKLKKELETYCRMLRVECFNFGNDEKELVRNKFKPKSTCNPRSKDAAIEIYLSGLEEKLMNIKIPKNK